MAEAKTHKSFRLSKETVDMIQELKNDDSESQVVEEAVALLYAAKNEGKVGMPYLSLMQDTIQAVLAAASERILEESAYRDAIVIEMLYVLMTATVNNPTPEKIKQTILKSHGTFHDTVRLAVDEIIERKRT